MLTEQEAEGFRLNMAAFVALTGCSDTPETDLAALLKSGHEIEPEVRKFMAEALEGRSDGIGLRATGMGARKAYRSYRRTSAGVSRARSTISLMDGGMKYADAVAATAGQACTSIKTIEADVARARKLDAWVEEIRRADPRFEGLPYADLEYAYLFSVTVHRDPTKILRQAVERRDAASLRRAVYLEATA